MNTQSRDGELVYLAMPSDLAQWPRHYDEYHDYIAFPPLGLPPAQPPVTDWYPHQVVALGAPYPKEWIAIDPKMLGPDPSTKGQSKKPKSSKATSKKNLKLKSVLERSDAKKAQALEKAIRNGTKSQVILVPYKFPPGYEIPDEGELSQDDASSTNVQKAEYPPNIQNATMNNQENTMLIPPLTASGRHPLPGRHRKQNRRGTEESLDMDRDNVPPAKKKRLLNSDAADVQHAPNLSDKDSSLPEEPAETTQPQAGYRRPGKCCANNFSNKSPRQSHRIRT